jgi:excisionase family DNA binding protein
VTVKEGFAELCRLIGEALPEDLPALLGALETAKAEAWSRMAAAMRPSEAGPEEQERLLTLPEVAERLGESEHFARELGRRGELPLVRLGKRHLRVRPSALREWIARHEQPIFPLTSRLSATYSKHSDREGTKTDQRTARADAGSTRRAGRRDAQLHRPARARGDRDSGVPGQTDSADRRDPAQDEQ